MPPPRDPPKWTLQKSMFWTAELRVPVFYDISRCLTDKYFNIVWGCHPAGYPPNWPPKNQIFQWLNLGCQSVVISGDIELTIILTLLFWRFHNQMFLNNCWFYGRQKVLLSVTALALRRSFPGFAGKLPSSLTKALQGSTINIVETAVFVITISLVVIGNINQLFQVPRDIF